jgi:hypothetical protein
VTHYSRRDERVALVRADAQELFRELDDHTRLSAHMEQSSWMMLGSRMELRLDAARGRAVGSRIQLVGQILGVPIAVDEVVTERTPPKRKTWETQGVPRLLVIGPYRMGFELSPTASSGVVQLRVFIEYALPDGRARWLARLLGPAYARWCVRRMAKDGTRRFSS